MFNNLMTTIRSMDSEKARLVAMIVALTLFVLAAGAPGAVGGFGG